MKVRTLFNRAFQVLVLGIGVFAVLPVMTYAQEVSSVVGTITDRSGGAIRDVEVTLKNANSGFAQSAKTNELGAYKFLRVPPAAGYVLTFTRDGFQKVEVADLYLAVNTASTHDVVLEVGSVNQLVEVTASAEATLNTTD